MKEQKEKLTYKNLLEQILVICTVDNEANVIYKNKLVGYFEINNNIKTKYNIELICIDKDFYNFIYSNYNVENKFLVWDWSTDLKDNDKDIANYYLSNLKNNVN